MKLAFSTLGCPAWNWQTTIARAKEYGYDGIEWRVLDGEIIGPSLPLDKAAEIAKAVGTAGLETCALDSGVSLAVAPGEERDKRVSEGKAMIKLAQAFAAPMLRVFPGTYPESVSDEQALQWMADTLHALIPDAKAAGVKLALEVHDSLGWDRRAKRGTSASALTARLSATVASPQVGVLWDLGNPYLEGETPAEAWQNLKRQCVFVHAKDMRPNDAGVWEYVLPGLGKMPLKDIGNWLHEAKYDGWVSVEWEKKWHPEIPDPEVAFPAYHAAMQDWLHCR